MKTRIRIFCPYFEWNESVRFDNRGPIGRGKFSSVFRCKIRSHALARDEADRNGSGSGTGFDNQDEVAIKVIDKSTVISQSMTKQVLLKIF
jgi:hypothetical protein